MRILRSLVLMALILSVSACAREIGASNKDIVAARHVSSEPPYIALVSMVDRSDERAAHTALLINASQRVLYDPAGTFSHPQLPERGDVHYGLDDRFLDYYNRYHARFSHYVHTQKVYVSPEVAEQTLRRTQAQGPSPKMLCTINTAQILRDIPQFSFVNVSIFPENLRRQFAGIDGVRDSYTIEEDREKAVPTD